MAPQLTPAQEGISGVCADEMKSALSAVRHRLWIHKCQPGADVDNSCKVHCSYFIHIGLRCSCQSNCPKLRLEDDYSYPILHDRDGQRSEHLDTAKSFYDRIRGAGATCEMLLTESSSYWLLVGKMGI